MLKKFKNPKVMLLLILIIMCMTGCKKKKETNEHKKIEFTVCDESKMPKELFEIIEEKKDKIFKISYVCNEYLYIAVGYGEHERGNLNVVVNDLFLTKNAVNIDTNLLTNEMTPTDAVGTGEASMYPYIVIKCEKYDLPVVFDID